MLLSSVRNSFGGSCNYGIPLHVHVWVAPVILDVVSLHLATLLCLEVYGTFPE